MYENHHPNTPEVTQEDMNQLFTPFNIGKVQIKNRFCMGPMGISGIQGSLQDWNDVVQEYFLERAKGGFGLITTGVLFTDTEIDYFDPKSMKSPLHNPTVFRRGAERLLERLGAYDTKLFCQSSMGVGRTAPGFKTPSSLPIYSIPSMTSTALTTDEVKRKIELMVKTAELYKKSGVHGIELHAVHWGYLLDQFVMAMTNRRTDEYGGTLENRMRVVKEIIEGIHQTCGDDYPISVRLGLKSYVKAFNKASLTGENEAGRTLEEGVEICKMLESYGVKALSVDVGTYDSFYYACPPAYMPKGHGLKLYAKAKEAVNIPILAGSRMGDPWICAKALRDGQADAFVLSRPSLADPEFPKKTELGMPEKIRPCIGCNFGCIGRVEDQGLPPACAVNPRAMRESFYPPRKATTPKDIMVIGGGVAGMEATRAAIQAGHTVTLYEKSDHLGGELLAAGNRPLKDEVTDLNLWYQRELKELNANIVLNKEITHEDIISAHPNVVILTVGASSVMPRSIPGIDHSKSVSAIDALEGLKPVGETVVVIGGGEIGCETAMHFALQGKKVSVVEAMPNLMSLEFVPNQCKSMLEDLMEHYHVPVYTGNRLLEINDAGAVIQSVHGESKTLEADTVVMSIGMRSNPSMKEALIGTGIEVYEIGSCKKPANIFKAVHDAFELIYNM